MTKNAIWSRRTFILGSASLVALAGCETTPELSTEDAVSQIAEMELRSGGRLGVSAMNKKTGRAFSHRGDERFAMCSSFKWLLAYFVVTKEYYEGLEREIRFSEADLVSWSPVTEKHVGKGSMTVRALCKAAVEWSDNTATNLLLKDIGGPAALTAKIRETGDTITRLDRWEPELNENLPGDPRDTTTPNAMTALVSNLLFGDRSGFNDVVSVKEMMAGSETGDNRLRAGMGEGWVIGDKTGTSSNNQSNDIAFAMTFPTNYTGMRGPVIITSYLNVENPMSPEVDKLHQEIGRISMAALTA